MGIEPTTACLEGPIQQVNRVDWLEAFVSSRQGERGLTVKGEEWVRTALGPFLRMTNEPLTTTRIEIEQYLGRKASPWVRHSHFRAIRAFFNWLEEQSYIQVSPCHRMKAPRLPSVVLGHPTLEQIRTLIDSALNDRDRAIISMMADTGLRLTELVSITPERISWDTQSIRILGKGRKERMVKFGSSTRKWLESHLANYEPGTNIWGLNKNGIQTMLLRLGREVGIKANPHSFRRFFAIELRRRGVDSQTIQYLGGWESLAMVERYSKAAKAEIALAEYVPLTD